jgi:hypothetical protein
LISMATTAVLTILGLLHPFFFCLGVIGIEKKQSWSKSLSLTGRLG